MRFKDRLDAGHQLAARLTEFADRSDVSVLALPRGGVPVAAQIARRLGAPLDVFLVRKLGVPGHPELAMGAIAEGGIVVLSDDVIRELGIPRDAIERVSAREQLELARRKRHYRGERQLPDLHNRVVVLVDDGLATGATMEAAVRALRQLGPTAIVVAVPVGAPESCERLASLADRTVCLRTPSFFSAVGQWYDDFSETSDEEVRTLLTTAGGATAAKAPVPVPVRIPIGTEHVVGDLTLPADSKGLVLFAHGSGSSRHSPRNQFVARTFERRGFATLLIDLLTPQDDEIDRRTAGLRFDIPLLATRLITVIDWCGIQSTISSLLIGLFGASTGAAAALVAAAQRSQQVRAVVSRGGRPDLAGDALRRVTAPTLLLVGGRDEVVIRLNQEAQKQMRGEVVLEIVPGATHLFEEPGALEHVAARAAEWFEAKLRATSGQAGLSRSSWAG